MKTSDFKSDEEKKREREIADAKMAENQTDYHRVQDAKMNEGKEGFFQCEKCESMNTSFYQQQTRGADEPMTNFCECLACGHKWN